MEEPYPSIKFRICDYWDYYRVKRRAQYAQTHVFSDFSLHGRCDFRISAVEWLFLLLVIFLVITLEVVNSAIENVVDLASNYHFSMLAKNAKDMAAGAVLLMSGYAVITGLIIFVPKLLKFFELILSDKSLW